jgi:hypothetical protein
MSGLLSPILGTKLPESGVVSQVEGDKDEVVGSGYGGDLPIRDRRSPPGQSQARPFGGVPPGGTFVVWQNLDGRGDNRVDIFFDSRPPLGGWEPVAAEQQLVPDDRSGGEVLLMSSELRDSQARLTSGRGVPLENLRLDAQP